MELSTLDLHVSTQTVCNDIEWVNVIGSRSRLTSLSSYLALKRAFDITVCLLAMPVLLPVLLLCFLIIKIESPNGPAVFTQYRTGRHGKRFKIYKFRTMVTNAEEMKQHLLYLNELKWPDFKITRDPRVTRFGRILRKTSLDELPQIINILKGEMSFVGPRPTSFAASTYKLWQTERLDVVPGLTGLWQVYGRAQTEFNERLRLDIAYIQNRCFLLDMIILLLTVGAVFEGKGSH
ncbi:MAG: sugar transferase [Chloroflexales bacterium]